MRTWNPNLPDSRARALSYNSVLPEKVIIKNYGSSININIFN